MKTAINAVGIFFAAIAIALVVAVVVGTIFTKDVAVPFIAVSPLVGIGAAVGYIKDRREKAAK